MRSTGIMAVAYNKLKTHLGLTGGESSVPREQSTP